MGWPDEHSLQGDRFNETLLHTCEDGHNWNEQADGGVSPSWGFGLTSVKYPGWDPRACPEPERGWSRYDDEFRADQGDVHHGYKCPTCSAVHYVGGCLSGVRCDPWNATEKCEPPAPVCGKPPVTTRRWVAGIGRGENRTAAGWVVVVGDPAELQPGEQGALAL